MKIEEEILINQYGQGVVDVNKLLDIFDNFNVNYKKLFLNDLLYLILQSKPENGDIDVAINN